MSNQNTINALMARGIDSEISKYISNSGHTLNDLKQMSKDELLNLGLSSVQIKLLWSENRPPIPTQVLSSVLHKSKMTCCICRDHTQPVVVHHIIEWAKSRSHDENNLVALCLTHHNQAHTTSTLSQNLSPEQIKHSKDQWESDILKMDAKNILNLRNESYSRWDWFNKQRVSEIMLHSNIKCTDLKLLMSLKSHNIIDNNGLLTDEKTWIWAQNKQSKYWFLDFWEGMFIAKYITNILDQLLSNLPLRDVTEYITHNKQALKSIIKEGDYIAAQLPFYFKDIDKFQPSQSQYRRAYYKGNSIILEYTFDSWYCMSSSARCDAMRGRRVQTIFGQIRSIVEEEGDLIISISCLAAGTYFEEHEARKRHKYLTSYASGIELDDPLNFIEEWE